MPYNQMTMTKMHIKYFKHDNPEVRYHHIYIIGKWVFFIIPGAVYDETYFCVRLRRLLIVASVRLRMQLGIITQLQYVGG
jgi:hypothetical protein